MPGKLSQPAFPGLRCGFQRRWFRRKPPLWPSRTTRMGVHIHKDSLEASGSPFPEPRHFEGSFWMHSISIMALWRADPMFFTCWGHTGPERVWALLEGTQWQEAEAAHRELSSSRAQHNPLRTDPTLSPGGSPRPVCWTL